MFWKQSTQFRLYLKVNNEMIPAVKLNNSFVYFGKEFCYNMSCEKVKCYYIYGLSDYLEKIDILFLHPKHKINILTKFAYSKLRWNLTIHHFPETWIVKNLDNKANRYIRKWLSMPISGNVNHLRLEVKQLDIGLKLPSDIYRLHQRSHHIETSQLICKANQLAVFYIKGTLVVKGLKSSKNQSMRELF